MAYDYRILMGYHSGYDYCGYTMVIMIIMIIHIIMILSQWLLLWLYYDCDITIMVIMAIILKSLLVGG